MEVTDNPVIEETAEVTQAPVITQAPEVTQAPVSIQSVAADTPLTSLQQAIENILGEYEPIEKTWTKTETELFTFYSEGTTTIVPYEYEVQHTSYLFNFTWFAGAVVFIVFLYTIFRTIGGMLKGGL